MGRASRDTWVWAASAFLVGAVGCTGSLSTPDDASTARDAGPGAMRDAGGASDDGGMMPPGDAAASTGTDAGVSPASDSGPATSDCTMSVCFFVRPGATGTGDGSDWDDAFTAIPDSLMRGATYFLAAGTYTGDTFDDASDGTRVITLKKAVDADHGTDVGWLPAYAGQAVFDGGLTFDGSYYVLDGRVGGGPGSWTSGLGIRIEVMSPSSGAGISVPGDANHHVVLSHFEVEGDHGDGDNPGGSANDGINLGHGTNITVSYAYIHDMGRTIIFSGAHDSVFDHIYAGEFESTSGEHAEVVSMWRVLDSRMGDTDPVRNVTFSNSIFAHVEGTGGLILQSDGARIFGNVFYKPEGASFDYCSNGVIGTWSNDNFTNAVIYNNTFIDISGSSGCGRVFGIDLAGHNSGNSAFNNLVYGDSPVDFGGIDSHGYNYFVSLTEMAPADPDGASATGNPFNITSYAYPADDFTLRAATPAGTSTGAPSDVDPLGRTRGADGVWDRGAYEF